MFKVPKGQLQKLQRVENAAARLVTNTRKYAHNHTNLEKSPVASCGTAFDIQISSDRLSGIEVLITIIYINSIITHRNLQLSHLVLVSGHLVNFS